MRPSGLFRCSSSQAPSGDDNNKNKRAATNAMTTAALSMSVLTRCRWWWWWWLCTCTWTWTFASLTPLIGCASGGDNAATTRATVSEWRIQFYTGNSLWAGTDSDIVVELTGTLGASPIQIIRPGKLQMEAQSVDTFALGDVDERPLGTLTHIGIVKQHTYALFNDWQLVKVVVLDRAGRKYAFNCNCWFTTTKNRRILNVTSIDGQLVDQDQSSIYTYRPNRVFPITICLLFVFFTVIIITYFGKIICNRWRENIIRLTISSRDRNRMTENNAIYNSVVASARNQAPGGHTGHHSRANHSRSRQTAADPARSEYFAGQVTDQDANLPLTDCRNLVTSVMQDKPPEYKELFPNETVTVVPNNQTNKATAMHNETKL